MLGATDSAAGFEHERDWARACWTALAPYHAGVYVNWLMDEGERRVREAYGEPRYERLQAVKRRYDPENVFRLNQNIRPA
jgi:FAD/FMN-containing dehydrogenase